VSALSHVMFAIPSALVFFSVGGQLEMAFGTVAVVTGVVVASVIVGACAWVLTRFAVRSGLDSDLMSIVAGFGRQGSAVTSGIYTLNFIVLFALEDAILASAVSARVPAIPRSVVYIAVGCLVLVVTWRGVRYIAPLMKATLPLFCVLLAIALVDVARMKGGPAFWGYAPAGLWLNPSAWLSVLAALLAFIVNATVAADVGRFLEPKRLREGSLVFGVLLQVLSFGGSTLLGAWMALRLEGNTNPGAYLVSLLGGWGLVCVTLSQTRINVINGYSGSLSLTNFGARGLRMQPGRHVWAGVLVVCATGLALSNIYAHLVGVLTFESVFVMAWVAALVSYILCRPNAAQGGLEAAPRLNEVGLVPLFAALCMSVPLVFGAGGRLGEALAPLVALIASSAGVVAMLRWRGTSRVTEAALTRE
jgi:hypothetical protein